jgi:serine/threonine protein kinase
MPWLKGLCDRVGPILQAKAGKVGEDIDFVHDVFQARCGNAAAPDIEEYVTRNPDRKLSQSEAKAIGVEIAATLCGLHAIDVVHRDLKPGNIICASGAWKIGDLGIAKNLARLVTLRTLQGAGTSGYAPPEQLDGVEAHPSADVYAFGKILVFLLSGQTDVDRIQLPRWRDLILRCTDRDRDHRPDAATVLAALQSILV